MKYFNFSTGRKMKIISTLLFLSMTSWLYGQVPVYSYYYRVYFRDKGTNYTSNYSPQELLSTRAMNRRLKVGIPVPDFKDIPVSTEYLNRITALDLYLHCTSKWMNTALFKSQTPVDINTLLDFQFVSNVKTAKTPGNKTRFSDKLGFQIGQTNLPVFDRPVTMVNGDLLHNSGYNGKGILIAVLDGGFTNADQISSLNALRYRNGIKATYDFVKNKVSVYNNSTHGTAVLSVLSGNLPGFIEGTAQGADYLLLKTEDVDSEFPCEEDFWAAGAEYADSSGADIITSSLGYYNFDDPDLNYKYSELNGKSAFITKAAGIAASKGILVVNSAGNERTKEWKRIIFPADGDSVIAVGAVDGNNLISTFSSSGPTADGRVKPDNVTMGVDIPVQSSASSIGRSNGTSFSCPVLSGMAACIMQAVPQAVNSDIIETLHSCADRHNSPDSLYGYGIPDMVVALTKLQDIYVKVPDEETIAGPNPTTGDIEIIFRQPPEFLTIEIISMTGKILFREEFRNYTGRTLQITELENKEQGIYFIRLIKATGINVQKIIKLRN
jgi:serine protease AprX